MKIRIWLFILLNISLLASCEIPLTDNTGTKGAGTISAYSGDGTDIQVTIIDSQEREVVAGEGHVEASGGYTYLIGHTPTNNQLSALFADLPSCAQVSDRSAKGVGASVSLIDNGQETAVLLEFMDAPVGAAILVRTYVDRDVSISGTCSSSSGGSLFYKVEYKRGWNLVYLSDDYGGLSLTSQLSAPSKAEVRGGAIATGTNLSSFMHSLSPENLSQLGVEDKSLQRFLHRNIQTQ